MTSARIAPAFDDFTGRIRNRRHAVMHALDERAAPDFDHFHEQKSFSFNSRYTLALCAKRRLIIIVPFIKPCHPSLAFPSGPFRMSAAKPGARLAVDIGGTFTDIVLEARGRQLDRQSAYHAARARRRGDRRSQGNSRRRWAGAQCARTLHTRHHTRDQRADRAQGCENCAGDHRRLPRLVEIGWEHRFAQYDISRQAGAAGAARPAPAGARAHRRQGPRAAAAR